MRPCGIENEKGREKEKEEEEGEAGERKERCLDSYGVQSFQIV